MESFERIVTALAVGAEGRLAGESGPNAAFLVLLCGADHPAAARAQALLDGAAGGDAREQAAFYAEMVGRVRAEVAAAAAADPALAERMAEAAQSAATGVPDVELLWSVFFPEGVGMLGDEEEHIATLRERRTVSVDQLNPRPIDDPGAELLLTSNVLLTVPAATTDLEALPYDNEFRSGVRAAAAEQQLYWYDHPIQIGVEPEANELLYGLRALDRAMGVERQRDPRLGRLRVVLSASVTHVGLRGLARDYVRHELARGEGLDHLTVHLFTDEDTLALVERVLAPLAREAGADDGALAQVFGVDGEYGRHYSFLKAIAALWQVVVDPALRATFKLDLDQVFPQELLIGETGASALEHLRSPLWGARGRDSWGKPIELGMIAGALVNERDIGNGLFTPDVALPAGPARPDERVFFSRLPQAISTRAEMMERYDQAARDGRAACLERIHVTGGTNGILVDALRRHRPFTPTFIGRAEDQAYILSVLGARDDGGADVDARLGYAHAAGLIMRHDKESFAGAAIEAARVGKLVGDDVRILYFSAYAEMLGRERVKQLIDPFTGCFASRLPVTVVMLRLALRIDHAFATGEAALGSELSIVGRRRLGEAIAFTSDRARFADAVEGERRAWAAYYDALDRLEMGNASGEARSIELGRAALGIVSRTLLE